MTTDPPRMFVPAGHFYSPIVDPAQVVERVRDARIDVPPSLPDVEIDGTAMLGLWTALLPILRTTDFVEEPTRAKRYGWRNAAFGYGDAAILRAMIHRLRPRRIIEIGSGFSSACILDTACDELSLATDITLVDPHPELMASLLKEGDAERVRIIPSGVQQVPLETFDDLAAGDILFIDSTHVVKTGSDVVLELTEILPRLAEGVYIHFHDIFYPFEYPYEWAIEHNRSWNELYTLRAFLAFNTRFEIVLFSDYLQLVERDRLMATFPAFFRNTGGSIWLRKR